MKIDSLIEEEFRLLEPQKKALKRLKLETVKDLLYHFPFRYDENFSTTKIKDAKEKESVTIYGEIKNLKTGKTFHNKKAVATGTLDDGTGTLKIMWFSQPYIAKMFNERDLVKVDGTITSTGNLTNPKIEKVEEIDVQNSGPLFGEIDNSIYPVYPESKGITSNWFYHAMQKIFSSEIMENIEETIPEDILEKYNLPSLKTSLIWIHTPQKIKDSESAKKRFSFEEILFIQIQKQLQRREAQKLESHEIDISKTEINKFIKRFPFKLTDSQNKAIDDILDDFKKGLPMSRLLEGDVGSGKTAVAATAVHMVTNTKPKDREAGNLGTAYMVPTEILAKQHFENFIKYFEHTNIKIGLITSSGCKKFPSKIDPTKPTDISRAQLLKWVENGEIPILIGTHSLIQKSVKFKNLALVIIDEQHRFGTEQRRKLAQKEDFAPHLLSMTATPIPRTLALTIYGDLDLTLLDEMPSGRKSIITKIVLKNERDEMYKKIGAEIKSGRQAYVICPRIKESDLTAGASAEEVETKRKTMYAKSVESETKILQSKIFPDLKVESLHGKMRPAEKDDVMKRFEDGEINILVSTSVIEVGVNVPNSTVILIEGAERFGLAQLHQLRGRVIRSNHQAYCFVSSESSTKKTIKRLRALNEAKNGFELAEYDLELRGTGELSGNKQWGISDLGMEAIKNIKMVEAARKESAFLAENINKYPKIKEISENQKDIHFE